MLAPVLGIQLFLWTLGGIYFSWFDLDNVHGDYERVEPVVLDLREPRDVAPIDSILKESALGRVEEIRIGCNGPPKVNSEKDDDPHPDTV